MSAKQRASVAQLQFQVMATLPEGPAIKEALDVEVLRTLEETPRTSWISPRYMGALMDAAASVGGVSLVESSARSLADKTQDHPLFRPLVQGALRLFGQGPGPLFKVLPRAWNAANRDSGELAVEHGNGRARVMVRGLPAELDREPFKRSWRGTCLGVLDLAGVEGTADIELLDGGFDVDVRW